MKHLLLIVFLFGVVGLGWHFYGATLEERVDIGEVKDFPLLYGKDSLVVRDQAADKIVEIESVTFSSHGFIVIQDDEQEPGRILGVAGPFEPGRRHAISVILDGGGGGYAFASLYRDDGDGVFSIETDIPIRGPALVPVQVRFLLATMSMEVEEMAHER